MQRHEAEGMLLAMPKWSPEQWKIPFTQTTDYAIKIPYAMGIIATRSIEC